MLSINITVRSGLFFAPFLRFIAPGYFGWTNFVNACDKFNSLIDSAIKTHAEKLDTNNHHDFIDHYLVEMRKCKDPNSSFYQQENLEAVIGDLFAAGSETNSGTLSFALLYLIQNRDAQIKAQREIDQRIGSSRPISPSDKTLLPYTEAILLETLRLSSVTPLGAPHRMIADTMVYDYFLPKDTTIIANLYGIHHDPKIWGEDVNEFRPERFLSEDETRVIRHDALMPFSAGKRILQNFKIEADPDTPILNSETPSGLLVEPQSFKFVLKMRNVSIERENIVVEIHANDDDNKKFNLIITLN
ncbi:Methyl farnesoate epoxidase [Orchesella cincta]|uniref:Methyl farnesoate epoxidase n=1 Tax=Orchesella cincta TaxID=48709 RepID=A0A1D2MI24_ORCCI|nr:Methyl farnesoate epoxidase [Orchesella cincta]